MRALGSAASIHVFSLGIKAVGPSQYFVPSADGIRWKVLRIRISLNNIRMNAADFRRIALSLEGAEEGSHMGAPDFRVDGRIFATLASESEGYGNLMLTPEQQADFVNELPQVFVPIKGGWGRMGMTHIVLAKASEDVLAGALRAAWKLRVEKNARVGKKKKTSGKKRRGRFKMGE